MKTIFEVCKSPRNRYTRVAILYAIILFVLNWVAKIRPCTRPSAHLKNLQSSIPMYWHTSSSAILTDGKKRTALTGIYTLNLNLRNMKKLVNWLMVNSDKLLHFIVCLLLAYNIALLDIVIFNRSPLVVSAVASVAVLVIGVIKELYDIFNGEEFDLHDLAADVVGLRVGVSMILVASLI